MFINLIDLPPHPRDPTPPHAITIPKITDLTWGKFMTTAMDLVFFQFQFPELGACEVYFFSEVKLVGI